MKTHVIRLIDAWHTLQQAQEREHGEPVKVQWAGRCGTQMNALMDSIEAVASECNCGNARGGPRFDVFCPVHDAEY